MIDRARLVALALLGLGVLAPTVGQAESEQADATEREFTVLDLPLGQAGTMALHLPADWTVAENDFTGVLPGALQAHLGNADNPSAVLVFTANSGVAPPDADAIDAVAETMIGNSVEANADLIANPVIQHWEPVGWLDPVAVPSRSYHFGADKLAEDGQMEIRLALIADGTLRYGIMMMTSRVEDAENTAALANGRSASMAYNLAVEAVVRRVAEEQ